MIENPETLETPAPPAALVLTTLQPMAIAGDSATGTWADLDIHTDAHGLPYIPRSRLNARLRTAAVQAATAHQTERAILYALVDLLGTTADHSDRPRLVQVDHAQFDDVTRAMVGATHAAIANSTGGSAARTREFTGQVTDSETTVLTHTAIARDRSPATGTLRSLRVLRKGTQLTAPLLWAGKPSAVHLRALALAVLGLTQLGRGAGVMGRISATLDGNRSKTMSYAGWETDA